MKTMTDFSLAIAIGGLLFAGAGRAAAAEDSAALYKKRCAGCHGQGGEGKPAMKAPPLKGTKLQVNEITERLTKGAAASKAPHNKGMAGLTEDQAKALGDYIKSLR
jgi:cytochrome c553